ncbi:MAG: phage holin family protein [Casimicrobium sp.]
MPADGEAPAGIAGNLLRSVQNLGGSFLAIVQTRLELLSTEIEEEWLRLAGFVLLALAALFCVSVAIVLAVVFVVAAFWDSYRLSAIVGLGAVFVLIAAVLWRMLVMRYAAKPPLFAASLKELRKDRERTPTEPS